MSVSTVRMETTPLMPALAPSRLAHPSDALSASAAFCQAVTRRRARNFYYGLKLTPEPKRSAMYAIYAWMRAADDLADAEADAAVATADQSHDDQPSQPTAKTNRIDVFRRETAIAMDPEGDFGALLGDATPLGFARRAATVNGDLTHDYVAIWPAFREAALAYGLPQAYFEQVIEGQLLDQRKRRYANFDELYDYCYKVASVVGLVCVQVWGTDGDPAVTRLAEHRGVALQLTNILRDLVEDAQRDRVYLPADELARFNYEPDEFADAMRARRGDERFDDLMAFQIKRAQGYYDQSMGLEPHLSGECRCTCWAMMRIYHGLLSKIADDPRRVLTQRVRLSSLQKAAIALHAAWRRGTGR